jgi:hypothetical protein
MKYIFLLILSWCIGFALPVLTPLGQLAASSLLVLGGIVAVLYYIDTRINAVRI